MSQGLYSDLDDPYIREIAAVFLDGYESEKARWEKTVESFDTETMRTFSGFDIPESVRFFEGKTQEEMLEWAPMLATAFGVAIAIRHAMEAQQSDN